MKNAHKLLCKTLPCLMMIVSLLFMSGCGAEDKKEDADLRDLLQDAIKKTRESSAVHIEGSLDMEFETTDILEDGKEKNTIEHSVTTVVADYYVENDKINYAGYSTSAAGESLLLIKDGKGINFMKATDKEVYISSGDELSNFEKSVPFDVYLNDIWVSDTEDLATYKLKEKNDHKIITIKVDDLDKLSESETNRYYKSYDGSISYYDFALIYEIDTKGYISKVSCEIRSDSKEKYEKGEQLGYDALVVEIKEKTKDTSSFTFTNYGKPANIDFSLLDSYIKK